MLNNGTIATWGYDSQGWTTVIPGLSNVVGIAAGDYHNVALAGAVAPFITRPLQSQTAYAVHPSPSMGRPRAPGH